MDAYIDLTLDIESSYLESLFYNTEEIFFRFLVAICFLIMGIISAKLFKGQLRAEGKRLEAIKQAYNESKKFEAVLENIGVGVVIQDLDYRILYENNVLKAAHGDNQGKLCYRAYENRDEICVHCPMVLSLNDGATHTVKVDIPSNGRKGHYELTTSPLMDPEGNVWGGIKLVQDITRDKEIEREIRQYRDELEQLVIDRTEALRRKNEALEHEIREHSRAEDQIRASLIEKDVLLKEIHHRVKNNMQIISSFISLQHSNMDGVDIDSMFNELHGRIRAMLLVHEKLYQSDDLSSVKAAEFIRDLVNKIYYSLGGSSRIVLNLDIADVEMNMDTMVPCGLLINELVTNALKYAFPGNSVGELYVGLRSEGALRHLTVRDNGVGKTGPEHSDNPQTLGFRIVRALVDQLAGEMHLHYEKGMTVEVSFTDKASKVNCWEYMSCGRNPGGEKADELGICPVFESSCLDGIHHGTHAGRSCWVVAGTLCEGRVQGTFADKEKDCMACRFYNLVLKEESENLHMSVELLRKIKLR